MCLTSSHITIVLLACFGEDLVCFSKIARDQLPLRTQQTVRILHDELNVHGKRLLDVHVVLEVVQEEVELFLRSSLLKVDATSLQQCANKANAEVVIRKINRVDLVRLYVSFMAVVENLVERVENEG